ncbi:hydrolase [Altererythrobacter sp. ZODW24]|uniref:hydrolase n=1 Tax=Altererythrobacter sp. ZODW24 TaxID=2185142 RepID=UPI000DF7D01B|nr:hydrolase [Altererythrobacter sp. ZODW24]
METNATPSLDANDNPTGCCPRFHPDGWDEQLLHFEGKQFVRATTRSKDHVPFDMDTVFGATFGAMMEAGAVDPAHPLVLSRDLSPEQGEHLFAAKKDVPGQEMVTLSGDFRTRVFDAPYEQAPAVLETFAKELEEQGAAADESYVFYTTCPKCAEAYGHNYMVAVDRVHAN